MKKINLFPMDWNNNQHWVIKDKKEFTWTEGMFHKYILDKYKLDTSINFIDSIKNLKELSTNNKKYNLFIKFYDLSHIIDYGLLDYLFLNPDNHFLLNDINSGKCKFILSSLTELTHYSYLNRFNEFQEQLKKYNIPENKITIFDFMNNLDSANKKFNVNFNFKYFNWLMVSWEYYVNLPKTQSNFKNKDYIRNKHYISLNKSVTKQHRPFLLHYLWKNNFLEKGKVSFFYEKKDRGEIENSLIDSYQPFYRINPTEVKEFLDWVENNPLSVDVPLDKLQEYRIEYNSESTAPNQIFNEKTDKAYLETYFNIITETCFIETDSREQLDYYLNERNILPINAFQPFIVLNGNNHMKELKKLGFKTFHPYIDETYDSIENTAVRFYLITKEIKKLCNMSKQEIHDWYWGMEDIYKHNYNHLHEVFYPNQIKEFYNEFIYE